jgi:hypothetical protein
MGGGLGRHPVHDSYPIPTMPNFRRSAAAPPRPSQPLHANAVAPVATSHSDSVSCRPYHREGRSGQSAPSWEDLLGRR